MRAQSIRTWTRSWLVAGSWMLAACAAEPEDDWSSHCVTRNDRDGDGVFRTDYSECNDGREVDPADQFEDCDDTNPDVNLHAKYYADDDHDGFGEPNGATAWICPGEPFEGFSPNGFDCAPDDPGMSLPYYRDADGDGAGGTLDCGSVLEHDHSMFNRDCDDADPRVSYVAKEVPFDGLDADCDGEDLPQLDCTGASDVEIPAGVSCDGVGLAFLAHASCSLSICGPTKASILVANIGTLASPVATLHIVDDLGAPQDQDIPALQPGEQTNIELPENGNLELTILLPNQAESCAPPEYLRAALTRTYTPPPDTQRTQCIK